MCCWNSFHFLVRFLEQEGITHCINVKCRPLVVQTKDGMNNTRSLVWRQLDERDYEDP